jgi:hypothetical protein
MKRTLTSEGEVSAVAPMEASAWTGEDEAICVSERMTQSNATIRRDKANVEGCVSFIKPGGRAERTIVRTSMMCAYGVVM